MYVTAGLMDPGLSDHHLVFTTSKKKKIARTINYVNCRNYRQFNERNFQFEIEQVDWDIICAIDDPNMAADLFRLMLLDIVNRHAPYRKLKLRENAPAWLNTDYLSHVDEREFWAKKCRKSPSDFNFSMKIDAIKRTQTFRDSLKRSYFQESLLNAEGDMKKTWQAIKKFWQGKSKKTDITELQNCTTNTEMANCPNKLFVEIGPKLADNIPVEKPMH